MGPEHNGPSLNRHLSAISARLRKLRRERGLTLREVSKATQLSQGFLSQIENERVGVSFSTLIRLAHFYGVNLSELVHSVEDTSRPLVSRLAQRSPAIRTQDYSIEWLVSEPDCALEVDIVTVEPGGSSGGLYSHEGEEFAFILEGNCTVEVNGSQYDLKAGDLLYFRSDVPHGWRNTSESKARILWCTTPPTV